MDEARVGWRRFAPKLDPIHLPPQTKRVANLPNALTVLRLILVIPFAILLFAHGNDVNSRIAATVIFVLAAGTDFLDGSIARRRNLVTTFGKVADPIADKALTGVALVGLSILGLVAWWITIVILVREVLVTLARFAVIRDGVISASPGGKAKTVLQLLAILLYLLPVAGWIADVRVWVMGIAVVLTVATGIDYGVRATRLHQRGRRSSRASAHAADADGTP